MQFPMDPLIIPTYLRVPKGIRVWEQDPNRQLAGSSCSFSFVLMLRRFEVWCPGEGMITKIIAQASSKLPEFQVTAFGFVAPMRCNQIRLQLLHVPYYYIAHSDCSCCCAADDCSGHF